MLVNLVIIMHTKCMQAWSEFIHWGYCISLPIIGIVNLCGSGTYGTLHVFVCSNRYLRCNEAPCYILYVPYIPVCTLYRYSLQCTVYFFVLNC
jgi:hypothetical protein